MTYEFNVNVNGGASGYLPPIETNLPFAQVIPAPLFVKEPEAEFVVLPAMAFGWPTADSMHLPGRGEENERDQVEINDASFILWTLANSGQELPSGCPEVKPRVTSFY